MLWRRSGWTKRRIGFKWVVDGSDGERLTEIASGSGLFGRARRRRLAHCRRVLRPTSTQAAAGCGDRGPSGGSAPKSSAAVRRAGRGASARRPRRGASSSRAGSKHWAAVRRLRRRWSPAAASAARSSARQSRPPRPGSGSCPGVATIAAASAGSVGLERRPGAARRLAAARRPAGPNWRSVDVGRSVHRCVCPSGNAEPADPNCWSWKVGPDVPTPESSAATRCGRPRSEPGQWPHCWRSPEGSERRPAPWRRSSALQLCQAVCHRTDAAPRGGTASGRSHGSMWPNRQSIVGRGWPVGRADKRRVFGPAQRNRWRGRRRTSRLAIRAALAVRRTHSRRRRRRRLRCRPTPVNRTSLEPLCCKLKIIKTAMKP